MTTIRIIVASVMLLLAACIVVTNWACVVVNIRNKKRGIERHHSMVPLMSVIFTYGAYLIFPYSKNEWIFMVPVLDFSFWNMIFFPIYFPYFVLRESIKKTTTEPAAASEGDKPLN